MIFLLLLALQLPGSDAKATAADSAFTRGALARALSELEQVKTRVDRNLFSYRFQQQSQHWGQTEQTWRAARRVDSATYHGDRHGWYYTGGMLRALYLRNEMAVLRLRVSRLPVYAQNIILDQLAGMVACSDPWDAVELAELMPDRRERSRALVKLTRPCAAKFDSSASRKLLRAAIALRRNDRGADPAGEVTGWMVDLHQLGARVSREALVRTAKREAGGGIRGQLNAATVLIRVGDRAAAAPYLAKVYRTALRTNPRPYDLLAAVHHMRATPRDYALARSYRDSMHPGPPPSAASVQGHSDSFVNAHNALVDVVKKRDVRALPGALSAVQRSGRMSGTLFTTTEYLRFRTEPIVHPVKGVPQDTVSRPPVRFAPHYFAEAWRVTEPLPAVPRDSARVALIEFLSIVDRPRAWSIAQAGTLLPRFRERAMAHVLARWSRTNASRAAREAASLRDASARNIIYLALARQALDGGRLRDAGKFADRTSDGEARVRAQYLVARAELESGTPAGARARIRGSLNHLDAFWRCMDSYCPDTMEPPPPPAAEFGTLPGPLIHEVIMLALRTGLQSELEQWSISRKTPQGRAAAWIGLVEGLAHHQLGKRPVYPIF